MNLTGVDIMLADDDDDDCLFFKDAIEEMHFSVCLKTVHNGEALMASLQQNHILPKILFLDLNMPLKNGFECLMEIKSIEQLKDLIVIIFTTASDPDTIQELYTHGANYFIQKPSSFSQLKSVLNQALDRVLLKKETAPIESTDFIIKP